MVGKFLKPKCRQIQANATRGWSWLPEKQLASDSSSCDNLAEVKPQHYLQKLWNTFTQQPWSYNNGDTAKLLLLLGHAAQDIGRCDDRRRLLDIPVEGKDVVLRHPGVSVEVPGREAVFPPVHFPPVVVRFMGEVALPDLGFKFSEVTPALIILRKNVCLENLN